MSEQPKQSIRKTYTPKEAETYASSIKDALWEAYENEKEAYKNENRGKRGVNEYDGDPYKAREVLVEIAENMFIMFKAKLLSGGSGGITVYAHDNVDFDRGKSPEDAQQRGLIAYEGPTNPVRQTVLGNGNGENNLRPTEPKDVQPQSPPLVIQTLNFSAILDGKISNDHEAVADILLAAKALGVDPEIYQPLMGAWDDKKFIQTADSIKALNALNATYIEAKQKNIPIEEAQKEMLSAFLGQLTPGSLVVNRPGVPDDNKFYLQKDKNIALKTTKAIEAEIESLAEAKEAPAHNQQTASLSGKFNTASVADNDNEKNIEKNIETQNPVVTAANSFSPTMA